MEKMDIQKEKENKRKKSSAIVSLILAFIFVLYFHLRLGTGPDGFQVMMGPSWGYIVLLIAMFFASFVAVFSLLRRSKKMKVELTDEEKKKRKEIRADFIFLFIDLLMSGLFVKLNWEQIKSAGILLGIAEVAAFFAIVWIIFEFFNRFKFFPERILKFVFDFFIYVCIPMLFLLVILLGAYQAKYGYEDVFKSQIQTNADKFAEVMRGAYEALVTSFYNIGQSNPNLWIWLPIAAFFVMTLWLLYTTFTRPIKKDTDMTADEIIKEAIKEDLEEQEYESGKKERPASYKFFKKINDFLKSKKDKEREAKEKEAEKNAKYTIYDVKLTELKGGKG